MNHKIGLVNKSYVVNFKMTAKEKFKCLDFKFLNIVKKGFIGILKVVVNYPYSPNIFSNDLLSYS